MSFANSWARLRRGASIAATAFFALGLSLVLTWSAIAQGSGDEVTSVSKPPLRKSLELDGRKPSTFPPG